MRSKEIPGNGNGEPEQSELKLVRINTSRDLITPDSPQYPRTRAEWATFPVAKDRNKWGEFLDVNGWRVMMEWEKPVEKKSIQLLTQNIFIYRPTILIGGEGLGYSTLEALNELRNMGGGTLVIIELHPVIIAQGEKRVSEFRKNTGYKLRRRINVEYIQGDFQEEIKRIPANSIDAARIDLFPLSEDEKDIDSFRHMKEVVRVLTHGGAVAPFVGHPAEPTDQQLSFLKDEGKDLFLNHKYEIVHVSVPPKRVCPYYQGDTMVAAMWSRPVKSQRHR